MKPEAKTDPTINEHSLKAKIITEIMKVYPELSNEFYGHNLYTRVRANVFRYQLKFPYADTVGRYFRQLREDGVLKCDCVNKQKSLYKKQP